MLGKQPQIVNTEEAGDQGRLYSQLLLNKRQARPDTLREAYVPGVLTTYTKQFQTGMYIKIQL